MAYVTIPKDLSKVQSKVLFGLTKRQVICFDPAAHIQKLSGGRTLTVVHSART